MSAPKKIPTAKDFLKLQKWYTLSKRDLPWRADKNPYKIWISEVMSQQSTLKTVLPYFKNWMKRFPTLKDLSQASEEEVVKSWEGLGYYSRARNVLKSAQALQKYKELNGDWPKTASQWQEFPGIGPYTASAIASIAFEQNVLAVDGNVIRVLSRLLGIEDPLNKPSDLKEIQLSAEKIAQAASQAGLPPSLTTQAFMELGSQICRPQNLALCDLCPLFEACWARKNKVSAQLPRVKKRREMQKINQIALAYRNKEGAFLLRKIPAPLRLSGQFELPLWNLEEKIQDAEIIDKLSKRHELLGPVSHSITHHQYKTYLLLSSEPWKGKIPEGHVYFDPRKKSPQLHTTTLSKKLFKLCDF